MSRVYTIELQLSADEGYDVAEFLAMHCRSHHHFHSHCPVGDMNCPFCVDACKGITAEDWDALLTNYNDIKTS